MSTLLEINGLYTSFGRDETEIKAVREVSLKIEKGETHALVGESGSGKSVTALSVMQLLPYPVAWHGGGAHRGRGPGLVGAPHQAPGGPGGTGALPPCVAGGSGKGSVGQYARRRLRALCSHAGARRG